MLFRNVCRQAYHRCAERPNAECNYAEGLYVECLYADCNYAECCSAKCQNTKYRCFVIMSGDNLLSVIMLSVII